MKYIRIFTTLVVTLFLFSAFLSCSSDEEPEEEVVTVIEPYLPPEPHWADGTITIEIGRFQTGEEMEELLTRRENFHAYGAGLRKAMSKEEFPMSGIPKTVEITVLTLQEIGFTKPVTFAEIRRRITGMGYRPLTLEEAVMARIDFTDQPDWINLDHKMTHFLALLSRESEELLGHLLGHPGKRLTLFIGRESRGDKYGEGYVISLETTDNTLFDPDDNARLGDVSKQLEQFRNLGNRFACVKE